MSYSFWHLLEPTIAVVNKLTIIGYLCSHPSAGKSAAAADESSESVTLSLSQEKMTGRLNRKLRKVDGGRFTWLLAKQQQQSLAGHQQVVGN